MGLATEDTWSYKTDMPTARGFVSGCVADGQAYVVGGFPTHFSVTSVLERYAPVADAWTQLTPMPSARCGHATCAVDGKIYVFGGVSPDPYAAAQKNVFVYDIQTDTWTRKADMPYANAFGGIGVVDGLIYLIGGSLSESSPPHARVMTYDPLVESWTQKADMPTARFWLSASAVDGKIYAIGGAGDDWRALMYKHVEVYDPTTDSWTRKADMPTARSTLGTCTVDGRIYAIGGFSSTGVLTANEAYDPTINTWTLQSPMQQRRVMPFVGTIGDKVYVVGGSYPGAQITILSSVEVFDTGLGAPSPDLNGDWVVNIEDLILLIEHWGKDDPKYDIAPLPFGDGIVDEIDLGRLMSYWQQGVNDPSLLTHWKLDEAVGEIAYDSAAIHDAVVIGDPLWLPEGGQVNGALGFDGVDDYVEAPYILNFTEGNFSILAWIQGGAPGQVIVAQDSWANWLMLDAHGCLQTSLARGRWDIELTSKTVLSDDAWHRVGFTWDGLSRVLYVDDLEVARDTQQSLQDPSGHLYIGAGKKLDSASFWSGLIDDVRIYNRVIVP
ncbi:kelch repeat-containing protein [Planctomycetota bacterium]